MMIEFTRRNGEPLLVALRQISSAFPDKYPGRKGTVIKTKDATYEVAESFEDVKKKICAGWSAKGARE